MYCAQLHVLTSVKLCVLNALCKAHIKLYVLYVLCKVVCTYMCHVKFCVLNVESCVYSHVLCKSCVYTQGTPAWMLDCR